LGKGGGGKKGKGGGKRGEGTSSPGVSFFFLRKKKMESDQLPPFLGWRRRGEKKGEESGRYFHSLLKEGKGGGLPITCKSHLYSLATRRRGKGKRKEGG